MEAVSLPEILQIDVYPRESHPTTCNSPPRFSSSPKIKRKIGNLDLASSNEIVYCNTPDDKTQEIHRSDGVKSWAVFLERFDIEHYRICVGLCSQALLWRAIKDSPNFGFWGNVGDSFHMATWCLGLLTLITVSIAYALKCVFHLDAVKKEYNDRVGVNYFFAPWISSLLLMLGVPQLITDHRAKTINSTGLWCAFMAPVICLEVKIYGQWFSGGKRLLSRVANPSTHLSIVGNFVGAMMAAPLGWKEAAHFLFAVGLAHYIVLFVTLYQRLPTNIALPKDLNPVFFLFLAVPSTASLAWEAISGSFGLGSRMPYFLALFLFATMAVRPNFFRVSRYRSYLAWKSQISSGRGDDQIETFSFVWWAYAFPLTAMATASIRYSDQLGSPVVKVVAFIFSSISTATVALLFISTVIQTLFFAHHRREIRPTDISPPPKRRKILQFELSS